MSSRFQSIIPKLAFCLLLISPGQVSRAELRHRDCFIHLTSRQWFTLDPANAFDAVSFIVTGNVYESLITFRSAKNTEDFVPVLASDVPTLKNGLISQDGTTYTFPIRKKVYFHNGDLLTPEDVRYSILRFMLYDSDGGPSALLLKPILGIYSTRDAQGRVIANYKEAEQAISADSDKVVIKLKRSHSSFLKIVSSLPIIVSRKWAVAHGEWDGTEKTWKKFNNRAPAESFLHKNMNGTGPYQLKKIQEGQQLVLKRHGNYWRKPAPIEHVFLKIVPSPALRLWMLETGDADSSYFEERYFYESSQAEGTQVQDNVPANLIGETLFFTFEVNPKSEHLGSRRLDGKGIPPDFFKDIHVRRGFAYTFNYEEYLKNGLGLRGKRALGPFPDQLLALEGQPRYPHDAHKAKQELQKAYNGLLWKKGFTLTLAYSLSNASRQVIAEILKKSLEDINPKFKVLLKTLPPEKLYPAIERHELPLFIASYYADYPDPQSFAFGMLHSSGYFPKTQRYSNPQMDKLVERAESLMDASERRKIYLQINEMAAEEVPQIYTYSPVQFQAFRSWVRGFDTDHNVHNLTLNNFPYFYALSKSN